MGTRSVNEERALSWYTRALSLYPKSYRNAYREQMVLVASDMLASAESAIEQRAVWNRLVSDLPRSICREYYAILGNTLSITDSRRFWRLAGFSIVSVMIPIVLILGTHLANQVGILHINIGRGIIGLAVILPFIAFILALAALQRITNHKGQHSTLEHQRITILAGILISSAAVLLVTILSLVITPHYNLF